MAGKIPDAGKNPPNAVPSEEELAKSLRRLDDKLGEARKAEAGRVKPDSAGYATGMKLSTEFVSAILVGAAIGWGIDRLFGVAPWAMILFVMLGFCAGVLNVMRSAGRLSDPYRDKGVDLAPDEDDDD